ncbi:MAG: amino acid--tRNA ligase-related protein, partial [Lawsonibacter sp.]
MEFVTGVQTELIRFRDIASGSLDGRSASVKGAVHALRELGGVNFITLRLRDGALQCVCAPEALPEGLCEECTVCVTGVFRREDRAPGGHELAAESVRVLSRPAEAMPVPVSKRRLNLNLDTELGLRPVALRNLRLRSVFKVQEGISRAFREYLTREGFTEVHTPKIVHAGAEGGSNIFRLDYFGRKAFLAQSPQFYKQTMVGVFERVFEVAPVFRAEKHSTPRHLNEYTSLDFEMGYLDGFEDIMRVETGFLQYAMKLLNTEYADELKRLDVKLPRVDQIPAVRFDEAKRLAAEKYGRPIRDPYDLEPEEEHNIGRYFQEEYGADFVFVT